jgi:hypothetical protein
MAIPSIITGLSLLAKLVSILVEVLSSGFLFHWAAADEPIDRARGTLTVEPS